MASFCSPLNTDLDILPSNEQLQAFYRNKIVVFEKRFVRKLRDSNLFRVTLECPFEKVVCLEVARLVFVKSLAARINTVEVLQKKPFICELPSLGRICHVLGKDNLIRRFNSGDFTIILPFYVVMEEISYGNPNENISKGRLVFGIEHDKENMKSLIPYGGSDPDSEDKSLPTGFSLQTIEVCGVKLQFPQYKGEGTLSVMKGYHFVYAVYNVVMKEDTLVIRNRQFNVIGVVRDVFDASRDVVRLDKSPSFNAQRCIFQIRRPVKIITRAVLLPSRVLKYVRKVTLKYHKEDALLQEGELQISFYNGAFNTCGIMTHDIALPPGEL